jgi:hypothetical protein
MTLVKKSSRIISVDGMAYRWRVRHRHTYCSGMGWTPLTLAAELAENPGRVLVAAMPAARPGNWLGEPSLVLRPADVAAIIQMALARGWPPADRGSAFRLSITGAVGP